MDDRRVARMWARVAFHRSEAARLEAEVHAVEAARGAGVSQWGSEVPPLFLRMVLERLAGEREAHGAIRATCSTWGDIHDAWCPHLLPWCWTAVMEGKMPWFPSVTTVNLQCCEDEDDIAGFLTQLRSLPSLRTLELPASSAEREVDAEAAYGLTSLTTLTFEEVRERDDDEIVEEAGEWVLDLSRMTSLTSLTLDHLPGVTDEQVQGLSNLTGLRHLNLNWCIGVTTEALCNMSRQLLSLTELSLCWCDNVTTEVLRAVSGLASLTNVNLEGCNNVTDEGLRTLPSLAALTTLNLVGCPNVTAAGKQALRTALPNLTIHD